MFSGDISLITIDGFTAAIHSRIEKGIIKHKRMNPTNPNIFVSPCLSFFAKHSAAYF
jgi:hypothetical protein